MVDDRPEALKRLEEQLDRASQAAERLAEEAGRAERAREERTPPESAGQERRPPASAGQERKPPPAGWQAQPGGDPPPILGAELDTLLSAIRAMRELIPPEVLRRLADALKEVLLAIRALLDFYIERLDRRPPESPEVQDIPIR